MVSWFATKKHRRASVTPIDASWGRDGERGEPRDRVGSSVVRCWWAVVNKERDDERTGVSSCRSRVTNYWESDNTGSTMATAEHGGDHCRERVAAPDNQPGALSMESGAQLGNRQRRFGLRLLSLPQGDQAREIIG